MLKNFTLCSNCKDWPYICTMETKQISIRLTTAEHEALQQLRAANERFNLSRMVREALAMEVFKIKQNETRA